MKKIIDNPDTFVDDMLAGIYLAHPNELSCINNDHHSMVKKHLIPGKVGIATGGGSGHLPLFLGYIGKGMADACCIGEVFQSPSAQKMQQLTTAINCGAGVLYIYGNYGGDRLNFEMAAEESGLENNISVRTVVAHDDVSTEDPSKRRGIAGLFFLYKIAGAAADDMLTLDEVAAITQKTSDNTFSIGVALSSCTIPRVGRPGFILANDEIEIGAGIHGESGIRREKLHSAQKIVSEMMHTILDAASIQEGEEVAVLINGLGATPLEEQYIVYKHVHEILIENKIKIFHSYVGEFATSMDMAGVSISVCKLDSQLKYYLSKPASSICFHQEQLLEE